MTTRPHSYKPMVAATCKNNACRKEFQTYQSWIARGRGKFCSNECARQARGKGGKDARVWRVRDWHGRYAREDDFECGFLGHEDHELEKGSA